MANRDVIKYYRDVVNQYNKLTNTVSELQKALQEGQIKEEQVQNFIPLVEANKAHMESLAYVIFLLKQPKFNLKNFFTENNDLVVAFKNHKLDKESHLNSTQELLDQMRELLINTDKGE